MFILEIAAKDEELFAQRMLVLRERGVWRVPDNACGFCVLFAVAVQQATLDSDRRALHPRQFQRVDHHAFRVICVQFHRWSIEATLAGRDRRPWLLDLVHDHSTGRVVLRAVGHVDHSVTDHGSRVHSNGFEFVLA